MRQFASVSDLKSAVGEDLGHGPWFEVSQSDIELFAKATGDDQWIHIDPVRAAQGPFGTTIAHGYLTLALRPRLVSDLLRIPGKKMGVNYGLNRVRFPAPLPSGSRIRAAAKLVSVEDAPGGVQVVLGVTVERESGDKPVCVAETVGRHYF